eukprot:2717151-Amphidinium_carterae.1
MEDLSIPRLLCWRLPASKVDPEARSVLRSWALAQAVATTLASALFTWERRISTLAEQLTDATGTAGGIGAE